MNLNVEQYHNPNEGRGYGIGGLVLGIIGLLTSCIPVVGLALGLIGLIVSIIGFSKANKANARKQLIIAAIIISLIASVSGGGFLYYYVRNIDKDFIDNFNNNYNNNNNDMFFDQNERLNEIDRNFDSMQLDEDEFNKLNKSMNDKNNGPGSAPIE